MSAKIRESDRRRSRPVQKRSKVKAIKRNKSAMFLAIFIVLMLVFSAFYVIFTSLRESNEDSSVDILDGNPTAIINTTKGLIKIDFYEDKVPNTCRNFIKLANIDFFEGLVFHRVANLDSNAPDTHIIQGGGFYPDGTRKESPYGTIDLEIHNDARHVDGAIAMARTNDPNSATSQFYICDGPQEFLDDNYAVFGIVIEGIDIVRQIASVDTTTKYGMSNWPENDIIINNITIDYEEE